MSKKKKLKNANNFANLFKSSLDGAASYVYHDYEHWTGDRVSFSNIGGMDKEARALANFKRSRTKGAAAMQKRYQDSVLSQVKINGNLNGINKVSNLMEEDAHTLVQALEDSFIEIFDGSDKVLNSFNSMDTLLTKQSQIVSKSKSGYLTTLNALGTTMGRYMEAIEAGREIFFGKDSASPEFLALFTQKRYTRDNGRQYMQAMNIESLKKRIAKFKKQDSVSINHKKEAEIVAKIENFISLLEREGGASISELKRTLVNDFQRDFGEALVGDVVDACMGEFFMELAAAGKVPDQDIGKMLSVSFVTGADAFKQEDNAFNSVFKTDVVSQIAGMPVTVKINGSEANGSVDVQFGFNVKTYQSIALNKIGVDNSKHIKKGTVSILGEGKTLASLINELYKGRVGRQDVYNTIAHRDQAIDAYSELRGAIVANYADYMISGTGKSKKGRADVSNFMAINGELVSINRIISQVANAPSYDKSAIKIKLKGIQNWDKANAFRTSSRVGEGHRGGKNIFAGIVRSREAQKATSLVHVLATLDYNKVKRMS